MKQSSFIAKKWGKCSFYDEISFVGLSSSFYMKQFNCRLSLQINIDFTPVVTLICRSLPARPARPARGNGMGTSTTQRWTSPWPSTSDASARPWRMIATLSWLIKFDLAIQIIQLEAGNFKHCDKAKYI